ncbi:MAG: tRNA threonylcarbamoyladenosine dehydratase [Pseudoflavonifractor sp.]|nr:tRNA threonylcarbamoyladenosine dehydratase [Alloprevotella sp.]MCM1117354.1 tRNA threonylcarbamoyladenosine dehydratase [Pseudoflavonifractor sp.]
MEILAGREGIQRLHDAKVAIFGIGGVGSWAAECLARSGIGNIDIIDADTVAQSNVNRQLIALSSTIGRPKAEVMKERILDINPETQVNAIVKRYSSSTQDSFDLTAYTYVIDAIDSLADKALLILNATAIRNLYFCSSMGAASRLNPAKVKTAEFWKVTGCPLAAALRHHFRKIGLFPHHKFQCVYSDEPVISSHINHLPDTSGAMTFNKKSINGAACHITSIFGINLAALVIQHILSRKQ